MKRRPCRFFALTVRAAVVACVLIIASASVARGQGAALGQSAQQPAVSVKPSSGPMGSLELTPEQKKKLAALGERHADEGKVVGQLFQTDPVEAMKRMVALRKKMQKEIRTVLTPEQRAIFDRNVSEMNAQMDAHMPIAPR